MLTICRRFIVILLALCLPAVAFAQAGIFERISAQLDRKNYRVVYFDFDADLLDSAAQKRLRKQAAFIRRNPNIRFAVTGHTDKVGNPAYNVDLGMRRARRVVAQLIRLGVSRDQLQAMVSQGERTPAINTEDRERLNRRVVTTVLQLRDGGSSPVARSGSVRAVIVQGTRTPVASTSTSTSTPTSTSTTTTTTTTTSTSTTTTAPDNTTSTSDEPAGKPRPGNSSFGTGKPDAGGGNGDEPSGDPEGSIGHNNGGDEATTSN